MHQTPMNVRDSWTPRALPTRGSHLATIHAPSGATEADPALLRRSFGLTMAEARVAALLAEGESNRAIARTLFISPHTARHHTERVLRKLGVTSRSRVAAVVQRLTRLHDLDVRQSA